MGLDVHHTPSIHTSHPPCLRHTPPSDERPFLPPIGLSISRPSSRLSTTSTRSLSSGYYEVAARQNVQLPGLSALASIAANTPPPERHLSHTPQPVNFLNLTPTPSVVPGGLGSAPPVCQNCSTSTTPLWRRDEIGSVLCNACGLFLKLHGKPRPISLKTDVIKSRNRVKAAGAKRGGGGGGGAGGGAASDAGSNDGVARVQSVSLAASHPGIAQLNPEQRVLHGVGSDGTDSPLSRQGTPGLGGQNIAPQHMFDQVIQIPGEEYGPSPSLPRFPYAEDSPSQHGGQPGLTNGHIDMAPDFTTLKTRVSELEVINDLFRGRVAELEAMLTERQQQADVERQQKEQLRTELSGAKRRIEELEGERMLHKSKRIRLDEFIQDDASGSDS